MEAPDILYFIAAETTGVHSLSTIATSDEEMVRTIQRWKKPDVVRIDVYTYELHGGKNQPISEHKGKGGWA